MFEKKNKNDTNKFRNSRKPFRKVTKKLEMLDNN